MGAVGVPWRERAVIAFDGMLVAGLQPGTKPDV
jgi:hypothetical protein